MHVAPGPHINSADLTTKRMMVDVLIALAPVVAVAVVVFREYAVKQIAICVAACLAAEYICVAMRGRKATLSGSL